MKLCNESVHFFGMTELEARQKVEDELERQRKKADKKAEKEVRKRELEAKKQENNVDIHNLEHEDTAGKLF